MALNAFFLGTAEKIFEVERAQSTGIFSAKLDNEKFQCDFQQ